VEAQHAHELADLLTGLPAKWLGSARALPT